MADKKFVDITGLTHYHGKLKEVVGGSLGLEGRTISLFNLNGESVGSVTIPTTVYEDVTANASGLMTAVDFIKLGGISEGANKVEASTKNGYIKIDGSEVTVYAPPEVGALASGLYKITTNANGVVTAGVPVTKADIVALGIPAQDTTYELASATTNGLLSKGDFSKLATVKEGANKVEASANGSVKIDGVETTIYAHPTTSGNKHIPTGGAAGQALFYSADGTAKWEDGITPTQVEAKISAAVEGVVGTASTAYNTLGKVETIVEEIQDKADANATAVQTINAKLGTIAEGATKVEASSTNGSVKVNGSDVKVYTHPTATQHESGFYKVAVDANGHISAAVAVTKKDLTDLGVPAQDTTYTAATGDKAGLQSAAHFTKVEGIEAGAQVNDLEEVAVNGSVLPVNAKRVNIDLSAYALKSDVSAAVMYRGTVASYSALPSNPKNGDMYNVTAADDSHSIKAGDNVIWNGSAWDNYSGVIVLEAIPNSEIDALFA